MSWYLRTFHKQGQTTAPWTSCPTLYNKRVGSFTSPTNHLTLKMQSTGPAVYSPCPRRLESVTICWCNCKGSTFYSECWSGRSWTHDLPHDNKLSYRCAVNSFWVSEWVSEWNNRIRAHNEICRFRSDIPRSSAEMKFSLEYLTEIAWLHLRALGV